MSTLAAPVHDHSVDLSIRLLETITAEYGPKDFAVRFWDGSVWGESRNARFTLLLKHPGALRRMLLSSSELALGEAYIYDDFDVEGDLESAFRFGDYLVAHELELSEKLRLTGLLLRLPSNGHGSEAAAPHLHGRVHSRHRDREAVTYHYDLSNDFYRLWLDRQLVYSCAYFPHGEENIDAAQEQKLDYICRKLRLKPGERVLDVGCGWGALILHAARNYGARALGITLSARQAELARERIEHEGLGERCAVEVRDYRDLDAEDPFDKIVSVGMFEHVGEARLPGYFQKAWELLRAGGVFLNHGIAASSTFRRKGPSFMDRYVFPDAQLVPLTTTVGTAEATGFEVRDVESLREHYARTLRHWVRRLEGSCQEASRLTSETVYRIWRIYMAGSAHAFATGRLNVYQVLLSKPERGQSYLPPTRAEWYR